MSDGSGGLDGRDFEERLKDDLPRGLKKPLIVRGRDLGSRAVWLTADEMQGGDWVAGDGLMSDAIMLGRRQGKVIAWKDDRHLLLIAGSRSGKGVSLVIPNLISYGGSALVIDPKGELAARTAGRRGKGTNQGGAGLGQDVYVLDPFGTSGCAKACFNPLAELNPDKANVADDSALFADALIIHPERGEKHWTESAQNVLQALILLVLRDPPEYRNLVTVRRLLTLDDDRVLAPPALNKSRLAVLIELLLRCREPHYGHICAGVGAQLQNMGENERGSVLSAALTQTKWLDSPEIGPVLSKSDFSLADLKRKKTTIYLCLPATYMGTYSHEP